ncbi:hypothetical protein [Enterobacter cloacae complex sp. IR5424]|uniref:hypothetical protein n=1 Tax=Enterobacter cloacae complex sp. IR5424 TaxID=3412364 RepID=UPI003BA1CA3C
MIHTANRTFHQLYREWIRERREHMHNVLTWERDRYGARLVGLFYRYCKVANPFPRCTLNTRINYRAHAVNLPDWPARSLELNKGSEAQPYDTVR